MRTGIVALTFLFVLIVAALWTRDIAEAQTSTPAIQTSYYISDGDQRVYVNDTFTIRFSMRRTSGGAGHGGISVSFPGLDQANSSGSNRSYDSPKASVVTDSYTNGSQRVSYFASGYSPIHKADGTQGEAEYLLVETDDTNWPLNTYRTLELEVTPKTTGLLIINYRYWLCGNGYQNCTYGPDHGTVDRQQGWHVDTFRVLVRNRRPAVSRESPQDRRVELRPGDTQTFVAEGTDRDGNLSQVEWYLDDESSGGQSLVPTGEYTDSATHSFPNAGTYRVSVTFTDTIGESGSTYWDVEVSDDIDVTVASDPPRRTITVDGTDRTTPYTTAWDPGTSLTLDAPSPQNVFGVNDRYVFSHWSHGGSQRQTVRPTTDTTYTANFTLQHFLSTRTEPRGIGIAGGGQWYDHGSRARVGPAPTLAGLQFSHWEKGDGEDIGFDPAGVQVTVDAAFLVVAVYTQASVQAPAQVPRIDSLGCAPTTVQVGQTVSCRPELSGGTPTEYDWDAIGGSPSSGAMRNFSTRWDTRGTKRVDFEACNDSGCDGQSQTILVDPGQGACFINWGTLPTGNTSVSGYWDGNCASTHRSGRYGRFYAFALTQRTRVQIGLASSEDTYLYLLSGADSEGSVVDEDDDGGSTGNNSHLDLTLEAGTYTIEATTYDAGATGDFSLTITVAEVEVFTLTADPPADLHKVAELQAELEKQEAELNKDNPDPPIEIPLLQMLRRVDHTAIFVVETDDADNEYATRFSLAVAGSQDDVTVTITASAEKDITILNSGGLFGTDYNGELYLEGSLTVRATHAGSRPFEIVGECLAEGGFAVILVEDKDLHMVDEGAILCEQKVIVGIPEPGAACIQALTTVSSPLHGVSPIRGAWTGHCSSEHSGGRYARYYTFTLPPVSPGSSRTVDVTLESFDADAYLYLLEGDGTDGRVIAENDNGPLQASQSQISIPLPGGTYTVEATTKERGVTGEFFLTVSYITLSVPPPLIASMGCAPLEVLVGESVTCRPTLRGGEPTRYLWGAIGGNPWSGTDANFSTQWDTSGEKRIVFEACNDAGCDTGEQTITVDAPAPLPPPVALGDPTNLRPAAAGPGQARLIWQPGANAEVHWIWSVKSDGTGGKYTRASGTDNTATVAGLETGQNYLFTIISGRNVNGVQEWSQWSQWVNFLVSGAAVQVANDDRAALLTLYNATGGPNWANNQNWASDEPLDQWYGVTTDGAGRVTELDLDGNHLSGEIPRELGDLSNLTRLFLDGNQLTGPIPPELGDLSNLTRLFLFGNRLSGEIPPELGDLSNLTRLFLDGNQLTGPIPPELGDLSNLTHLFLFGNHLSGEIPRELGDLSNLTLLFLDDNRLTGPIPPELGDLSNLTRLFLFGNRLSGEIPRELGDLSNLTLLFLDDNRLTGPIPPELGDLSNLTRLFLDDNQLTGPIPPELGNLSNLTRLFLDDNQLTGPIPPELGNLSNLTHLFLDDNQLTGPIPPELGNLDNLVWLYLAGNQLRGCVPARLQDVQDNDFDDLGRPFCGTAGGAPPASQQAPDLGVTLTISGGGLLYSGATATVIATVFNEGDGVAPGYTLLYYRSQDRRFTNDNVTNSVNAGALPPSTNRIWDLGFTVPADAGDYYFAACVGGVPGESDTTDNCSDWASASVLHPVTLTASDCRTENTLGAVPDSTEISGTVLARRAVSQANVIWRVIDAFGNTDSSGIEQLGSMTAGETKDFSISTAWGGLNYTCDPELRWVY